MKPRHSTLSGLVILALAGTAVADVYYSKFQNITIPTDYAGVYPDVDGGNGWNTNLFSPVSGWDINPYFGGSTVANSPTFRPVCMGFAALLGLEKDLHVVAEAEDAAQAVQAFRQHRPDITLMDARMPGGSGVEALSRIRAEFSDGALIHLDMHIE